MDKEREDFLLKNRCCIKWLRKEWIKGGEDRSGFSLEVVGKKGVLEEGTDDRWFHRVPTSVELAVAVVRPAVDCALAWRASVRVLCCGTTD